MAILKHLAIKNANYNDAFDYLTLQHDEFSMRPVLDENGLTVERTPFMMCQENSLYQVVLLSPATEKLLTRNTGKVKGGSYLLTKQPIKDTLRLKTRLSLRKKTELKSPFLRLQENT